MNWKAGSALLVVGMAATIAWYVGSLAPVGTGAEPRAAPTRGPSREARPTAGPSADAAPGLAAAREASPELAAKREGIHDADRAAAASRRALFGQNLAGLDRAIAEAESAGGDAAYVAALRKRRDMLAKQAEAEADAADHGATTPSAPSAP